MPADPLTEAQRANYVQLQTMAQEGLRLDDSDAHCLLAIIDDLCSGGGEGPEKEPTHAAPHPPRTPQQEERRE